MKQKTHKVLNMEVEGFTFVCIVHYDQTEKPFHLFVKCYDGRKRVAKVNRYQNMYDVIWEIMGWMRERGVGLGGALH